MLVDAIIKRIPVIIHAQKKGRVMCRAGSDAHSPNAWVYSAGAIGGYRSVIP
jgi:hypothetical protein